MSIYHHKWFPRIFYTKPDGGQGSGVTGFFLVEWKPLFSIGLLKFNEGSREAYHSHAFNAYTFWLKGSVTEQKLNGDISRFSAPSLKPKYTTRDNCHRVISDKETWALTLRGPWVDTWREYKEGVCSILTHGRKIICKFKDERNK